jgi:hypothetical protein
MTANTAPIFTLTPNVAWAPIIASANTAMDGTGTVNTVFTGGANGSFCQHLKARAVGSCVATVIRVFLNNGSSNATANNNALIQDITLPATTASNTAALPSIDIPINAVVPNGYKLNIAFGTATSAGWKVSAFGGDY